MRKYLFAAVAAGGVLLLGAAPAQADDRPSAGLLGGLLDPAGGILPADGLNVDGPVGDAPLVDVDPGDNTPSVVPALPAEGSTPAARTGLGSAGRSDAKPAASPAAAAPAPTAPAARRRVAAEVRPVAKVLRGLLPDGRVSDGQVPADADDPDLSGMPAGGSDVPPASTPDPAGDEAGGRSFSDGRPVAGTDPEYR